MKQLPSGFGILSVLPLPFLSVLPLPFLLLVPTAEAQSVEKESHFSFHIDALTRQEWTSADDDSRRGPSRS